jgi:beta-glucosidase/6-phospho-beta-glucosidase/beta-galactosidase
MSRQLYVDDIAALAAMHQNAYRFGIEWARLFPTAQAWAACRAATGSPLAACRSAASSNDLAYYHAVLDRLAENGITPLVTLVHSSLPSYIDDLTQDYHSQAWLAPTIVSDLGQWAAYVTAEFPEITWWITLNEPLDNLEGGYIDGSNPPGGSNDLASFTTAWNAMVYAHVAMYDALHAANPNAMVSIAQDVHLYYGQNSTLPADQASAAKYDYFGNAIFLNAIVNGDLDANYNGTIDPGEPSKDPSLRGRADYVGVNYYSFSVVQGLSWYPLVGGVTLPDTDDHGLAKTDRGWDIYPRGIGEAIDFAGSYGVPVVITENGDADATDANRPRFLAEHVAEVAAKIAAGAKVLGYFHWSTIDNFNWTSGYCPRYGLYATDYTDPARTRTARSSAGVYAQIIQANEVTDALLGAQPPYTPPSQYCPPGP